MPRLMSVSLTEPQVLARHKAVIRRMGGRHIRVGDRVMLCRKVTRPDHALALALGGVS